MVFLLGQDVILLIVFTVELLIALDICFQTVGTLSDDSARIGLIMLIQTLVGYLQDVVDGLVVLQFQKGCPVFLLLLVCGVLVGNLILKFLDLCVVSLAFFDNGFVFISSAEESLDFCFQSLHLSFQFFCNCLIEGYTRVGLEAVEGYYTAEFFLDFFDQGCVVIVLLCQKVDLPIDGLKRVFDISLQFSLLIGSDGCLLGFVVSVFLFIILLLGCILLLGIGQGPALGQVDGLPGVDDAHAALIFLVVVVGHEGRLGICLADGRAWKYWWEWLLNRFPISILRFCHGDGEDFQRLLVVVAVGAVAAILLIVAIPLLVRDFPDLNDDEGLLQTADLDSLAETERDVGCTHVDADGLPLLGLLVTTHIGEIAQRSPTFRRDGAEGHSLQAVA